MTTGAILEKDVPKEDPKPSINTDEVVDQGRLDALSAIANSNAEKRKGEFRPFDGDDVVSDQEDDKDQKTGDSDQIEPTDSGADSDTSAASGDGQTKDHKEEMVTVKIDGEERSVEKSKVDAAGGIRAYQKEIAANKRFEELAELKKALQAEREEINMLKGELTKTPPQKPEKTKEEIEIEHAQSDLKSKMEALSKSLAYDGPDEQMQALQEYNDAQMRVIKLSSETGAQHPVNEIIQREFERRDAQTRAQNHKLIMQQLEMPIEDGGYKDLLENERAVILMTHEVEKLLKAGAHDVFSTYAKAGDTIRDFLGLVKKDEPPVQPNKDASDAALAAKRQRKIETADTIKSTGATSPAPKGDDKPMSRDQFIKSGIASLIKARGQDVAGL